jgi:hypothetical protein
VLRDNVFGGGSGIASADGQGVGVSALTYHYPGWDARGNVVIGAPGRSHAYPAGNLYPSSAAAAGSSSDRAWSPRPALGSATTDGSAARRRPHGRGPEDAGVVLP